MKTSKRIFLQVMLVLGLVMLSVSTANAANITVSVSLPVKQKFVIQNETGDAVNETGVYELVAEDDTMPLPEGSQNGIYSFSIQGTDREMSIPFRYDHAGVYRYSLRQITKDAEKYSYDRASYRIIVYVQNEKSGELSAQMIVQNASGEKCGEVVFHNSYKSAALPNPDGPAQTGDNSSLVLWIVLGIAAVAGIGILTVVGKKRNR